MKKFILTLIIFITPLLALAKIEYKLTMPIPGVSQSSNGDIGSYVATLFQFGLAIVGLVAFAMIVFNGVKYIMGAGNESLVGDAKVGIWQAIVGVLLLLASVVLLNTINPCILSSVKIWGDGAQRDVKCATNNFGLEGRSDEEIREAITDNLSSGQIEGIRRIDRGGTLEIAGTDSDNGHPIKILVSKDGSYTIHELQGASYIQINQGTDINTLDKSFINIKEGYNINEEVRAYLLEKTKEIYANDGIPLSDDQLDREAETLNIEIKNDFKHRGYLINGRITCEKISNSITPYYKCLPVFITMTNTSISTPILERITIPQNPVYIEFPANNSRDKTIIENYILKLVNSNIQY